MLFRIRWISVEWKQFQFAPNSLHGICTLILHAWNRDCFTCRDVSSAIFFSTFRSYSIDDPKFRRVIIIEIVFLYCTIQWSRGFCNIKVQLFRWWENNEWYIKIVRRQDVVPLPRFYCHAMPQIVWSYNDATANDERWTATKIVLFLAFCSCRLNNA